MVWQSFPERMVGFLTWNHFWDEARGSWGYTAERANEFSMVLTSAAFYHRYRGPETPTLNLEQGGMGMNTAVSLEPRGSRPLPVL